MSTTNGGYGRGRAKFTDEQRAEWGRRYDAGEKVATIARDAGCTAGAVYHYLTLTGRYEPKAGRIVRPAGLPGGPCIRCGIDMGRVGLCLDCCELLGVDGHGCTHARTAAAARPGPRVPHPLKETA